MSNFCLRVSKDDVLKKSHEVNGRVVPIYVGEVSCNNIVNMSNDSNVRAVNPAARVIKDIIQTLTYRPELMPFKSRGITAKCSRCEKSGDYYLFEMKNDDGILDGGHNRHAIISARDKGIDVNNIRIPIRIFETNDLDEVDIVEISTALNSSSPPSQATFANVKGYADIFKSYLRPEYNEKIEWRQNTMIGKAHLESSAFISLLHMLDISKFSYYDKKRKAQARKGNIPVTDWANGFDNYDHLAHLSNDILELYDTILTSLERVREYKGSKRIPNIDRIVEGKKKGIKNVNDNLSGYTSEVKNTLFTNEQYHLENEVAWQYIQVIIAGMRANMRYNADGRAEWVISDVVTFFKEIEGDIWSKIVKEVCKGKQPTEPINISFETRKGNPIWDDVFDCVELAVRKRLLGRLSSGKSKF